MPNIQVKDVPEDVHRILRSRAAAAGQSLQEYLLARLTREARRPTLEEVIQRMGQRSGGRLTPHQAAALLREDRER
ncbi:FitA-like ribbon-helix-helix domain-containing protein [Phytohabitans kaempferiae]|uniref:Antitoxin FitA-like ribbon-helix-helix domain-containing protein n=1 Tax=Phytohabitans kaempferiae TaxID=1620943 RepID=A0ABV6M946_9ACTN